MKRDVVEFVSKCLVCQQVKTPRQKTARMLQPLSIPKWKWENIAMDLTVGLPRTLKGYTIIWVIVNRLTKSVHFLLEKTTYTVDNWAQLFVKKIVRLHKVSVSIVLNRELCFTSAFWRKLQKVLGTRLDFSIAFHPQTDGQTEEPDGVIKSATFNINCTGYWNRWSSPQNGRHIESARRIILTHANQRTSPRRQKFITYSGLRSNRIWSSCEILIFSINKFIKRY